jgi:hypothetical protein
VDVYLYYQGYRVKKFDVPFTYLDYIEILEVYPKRGTKLGGTKVTLKVRNMPSITDTSYTPICKFSFDFLQTGTTFTVAATRLNETHI